jgi:hypothetical protein
MLPQAVSTPTAYPYGTSSKTITEHLIVRNMDISQQPASCAFRRQIGPE